MAWNDLSMRERNAYIQTAIKNGIYDRLLIIDAYNKFGDGGSMYNDTYDISNISGTITMTLPNGSVKEFANSKDAQQFFEQNYGKGYNMAVKDAVKYDIPPIVVSNKPLNSEPLITNPNIGRYVPNMGTGFDRYTGSNNSSAFKRAYYRMGDNLFLEPLKYINPQYWDSPTHKNLVDANNLIANGAALALTGGLYNASPVLAGLMNLYGAYEGGRRIDTTVENAFNRGNWTWGDTGQTLFGLAETLPFMSKLYPTIKTALEFRTLSKEIKNLPLKYNIPTTPNLHTRTDFQFNVPSVVEGTYAPYSRSIIYPRKSTLSKEELLGIPKGERNLPVSRSMLEPADINKLFPEDIPASDRVLGEYGNSVGSGANDLRFITDWFSHEPPSGKLKESLDYVIANTEADPRFKDLQYVLELRNYYYQHNIDLGDYSDEDLAKIITNQYNQLTSGQTGLLKGKVLWRGDKTYFDKFNWQDNIATHTHNRGAYGEGLYFNGSPTEYGRQWTWNKNAGIMEPSLSSSSPYLINGVTDARYTSYRAGNPDYSRGNLRDQTLTFLPGTQYLKDNPNGVVIGNSTISNSAKELVIARNTGIKSLYPAPETATGKGFAIDWNDPSIHGSIARMIAPWLLGGGIGTNLLLNNYYETRKDN